MRQVCCLMVSLILFTHTKSQPARLYMEADLKGGYKLMAEKKKAGTITVDVQFTTLNGYRLSESNPFTLPLISQVGSIATLTREPNSFSYNFAYTYKTYVGRSVKSVDTLFPYLLPIQQGHSIVTSGTYEIGNLIGKSSNNYYSIGFRYKTGDTIVAARAGTIISTNNAETAGAANEIYNEKSRGNIVIEHEDGTMARYNTLQAVNLLVTEGDLVHPGAPIAVFSGEGSFPTMLLSVSYLNLAFKDDLGSHYKQVVPMFYLDAGKTERLLPNNTYSSMHPQEIIIRELTKKQKKKLGL